MKINQKKWFKQKERSLNSTGKLDLSCEVLEDLSFIGSRPSMKVLDLSFTSIISFEGLAIQPKLEHLILDGSTISSFKNASSIANITKISLQNTPISNIPNYKISLLLVCSKNLRIINGKIISESIKKKAKTYPPIAAKLVDHGWIAQYPCPDEKDLFAICAEYGIQFIPSSPIKTTQEGTLFKSNNISDIIDEYTEHHEELVKRYQIMKHPDHYCSMTVTDSNRDYLLNGFQNNETDISQNCDFEKLPSLVCDIIKKYGFNIDEGDPVETITSSLINIFNIAEGNENSEPNALSKDHDDFNYCEDIEGNENQHLLSNFSQSNIDKNTKGFSDFENKEEITNEIEYFIEEEEEEKGDNVDNIEEEDIS